MVWLCLYSNYDHYKKQSNFWHVQKRALIIAAAWLVELRVYRNSARQTARAFTWKEFVHEKQVN